MNNINVTVELCAEDRARLDRLTAALEARAAQEQGVIEKTYDKQEDDPVAAMARAVVNRRATTQEAPKNDAGEAKASDHPVDPFPETSAEQAEPPKETAPNVTLADIQQLILALAAVKKTSLAREVVHGYGVKRATDLPESVYAEVYEKLRALEG